MFLCQQNPQGLGILDPAVEGHPLPALPFPIHEDYLLPAVTPPNLAVTQVSPISVLANPYTSPALSILQRRLENASSNVAVLTPLPSQTNEEVEDISAPLTRMEMNEIECGFGEQPLEISGGLAATEEAVGLHVEDLITQV